MIPSFGMLGILSAITLLISAWSAWQAWWGTSPSLFWTYIAFWVLGIPAVLGGVLFLLQNTSLGDRLVLRGPASADNTDSVSPRKNELTRLIGEVGIAKSLLTPGGIVHVNNVRYHAESPGMVIEAGSPVRVVNVKANRLVVRAEPGVSPDSAIGTATSDSAARKSNALADTVTAVDLAESATAQAGTDGDQKGILDFDIPED
ncbi:MAG: NfeD family protein [Fuerstiella sp.]